MSSIRLRYRGLNRLAEIRPKNRMLVVGTLFLIIGAASEPLFSQSPVAGVRWLDIATTDDLNTPMSEIDRFVFSPDAKNLALIRSGVVAYLVRIDDGRYHEYITANAAKLAKAQSSPFAGGGAPNRLSRSNTILGQAPVRTRRGNQIGLRIGRPLLPASNGYVLTYDAESFSTDGMSVWTNGAPEEIKLVLRKPGGGGIDNPRMLTLHGIATSSEMVTTSAQLLVYRNSRSGTAHDYVCVDLSKLEARRIRLNFDDHASAIAVGQRTAQICLLLKDGIVIAHADRVIGETLTKSHRIAPGWPSTVRAMAFANNDRWLAIGGYDRSAANFVVFIDVASGEVVHRQDLNRRLSEIRGTSDGAGIMLMTDSQGYNESQWLRIQDDKVDMVSRLEHLPDIVRAAGGENPDDNYINDWSMSPDGNSMAISIRASGLHRIGLVDTHIAFGLANHSGVKANDVVPLVNSTEGPDASTPGTSPSRLVTVNPGTTFVPHGPDNIYVASPGGPTKGFFDQDRCEFTRDGKWLVWYHDGQQHGQVTIQQVHANGHLVKQTFPADESLILENAHGFRLSPANQLIVFGEKVGGELWQLGGDSGAVRKARWPYVPNSHNFEKGQFLSERWFVSYDGARFYLWDLASTPLHATDSFPFSRAYGRFHCTPRGELLIFEDRGQVRRLRVNEGLFESSGNVTLDIHSRDDQELGPVWQGQRLMPPTTSEHSWAFVSLGAKHNVPLGKASSVTEDRANFYLWQWNGEEFSKAQMVSLVMGSDSHPRFSVDPTGGHIVAVFPGHRTSKLLFFDRDLVRVAEATTDIRIDGECLAISPDGSLLCTPSLAGNNDAKCNLVSLQLQPTDKSPVTKSKTVNIHGRWSGGGFVYQFLQGPSGHVSAIYGNNLDNLSWVIEGELTQNRLLGRFITPASDGVVEMEFATDTASVKWRHARTPQGKWDDQFTIKRSE